MGHYDDQREADFDRARNMEIDMLIQDVKRGTFDDIVKTASRHNNYVAIIDSRVLDRLLRAIRERL